MPAFRYKHGDRPLDGYVIQRGVGRGGFGEVYYAISDSGREVALKVIQGYEQIELRGVSQCMNLKSQHLVTIFDVRHNADGIPFVIMEYVGGPSLRELCDQQPAGLGIQKAAFFLREIGKGLTFLHDSGIVHRDLKPGNIFYENGAVKIGDYGLSKAMSASQHSGQTVTVGTVHYMAPEIGLGRYDRSIDIYAMGAVLFEMITGQVPYLGASAGEILMKHMSSEPNVAGIEEPFASVIKKAMHKDPALRYQTIQEMVEAVFGAEHVRDSVSGFSPGDLSMVAGRVAGRIAVGVGGSSGPPMPPIPKEQPDSWQAAAFAERPNRMSHLATPPPLPIPTLPEPSPSPLVAHPAGAHVQPDPIPAKQRYILTGATVVVIALACFAVAPGWDNDNPPAWMFFSLLSMTGGLAAMFASRRWLLPRIPQHAGFVARLSVSAPTTLLALIAPLPAMAAADNRGIELLGRTWAALILPLVILNWVRWTSPHRVTRVSLVNALLAGAFGLLMAAIFRGSLELAVAIPAGIALASGVLFAWTPRMFTAAGAGPVPAGLLQPHAPAGPQLSPLARDVHEPQRAAIYSAPSPYPQPIPDSIRWLWRAGMALFIALGPTLIAASAGKHFGPGLIAGEEEAITGGFGAGFIFLGVVCFFQSFRRQRTSWWSYLIKPLVLYACFQIIMISAFMLGIAREEEMVAIFFVIFPAIMFLSLLFVTSKPSPAPARPFYAQPAAPPPLPLEHPHSADANFLAAPPASTPFAPTAPAHRRRRPHSQPQKLRYLGTFIGWSIHALTLTVALLVAIDLPGFIEAGLADKQVAIDLNTELGPRWPQLLRLTGYILTCLGAFAATTFLMVARRSLGVAHMIRPIFAAVCFILAMFVLDQSLSGTWKAIVDAGSVNDSILKYLEVRSAKFSIVSLLLASLGLALLLWPAPPTKPALETAPEDGVS